MSHRSPRPTSMRHSVRRAIRQTGLTAGCVLLLATAVGCGNEADPDSSDTASDPSSSPTSSSGTPSPGTDPSESPTDSGDTSSGAGGELTIGDTVEPGQAVLVSASNIKIDPAPRASALVDDAAVDAFVAATDPQLADGIRAAAKPAAAPSDSTLFGAVAAVGCDAPTSITWTSTFDGIEIASTMPKKTVQCLVPVTYVALFLVPN